MATFSQSNLPIIILLLSIFSASLLLTASADFYRDAEITWGDGRAKILEGGRALTLSLDQYSGSGFQSKNEYLFGRFDLQLKLVPGNSAGTVTTFFLSSQGAGHDEIDFEFLGNSSGEPYTVHTNVYAQGKGDKEQQFHLWFDPTSAFHTYSIVWNPQRIMYVNYSLSLIINHHRSIGTMWNSDRMLYLLYNFRFMVDNIPIRVYNNQESIGTPFPKSQPMRVHCSLWNADDWATQGGRVKTDWTKAPFVASYRNFNINGCVAGSGSSCGSKSADSFNTEAWRTQELDANGRNRLRWVQQKHMVYNYCADSNRFHQGIPAECKRSRF
ncbi:hypothetical protein DH2020_022585 [Rehmannia glutinosa]|uniref:Xyloglucan endotransglucosylase/hydrolase n=1 Tax=Rehmannia glutinosa TaxID=99300 RepID=A0ABR0W4I3_REHGL